jgi:hypothetical protein
VRTQCYWLLSINDSDLEVTIGKENSTRSITSVVGTNNHMLDHVSTYGYSTSSQPDAYNAICDPIILPVDM